MVQWLNEQHEKKLSKIHQVRQERKTMLFFGVLIDLTLSLHSCQIYGVNI